MKHGFMTFATMTALAAGMAFAQTTAPAPAPAPGQTQTAVRPRARMHQRIMQALNLTADQKAQAKSIFGDMRQQAQPVREQLKQNREALAAAVKANDTNQIQTLSAKQGSLQGQVVALRAAAMAKFYGILTPDQRAKADQIHARIHERLQQRFHRQANNG